MVENIRQGRGKDSFCRISLPFLTTYGTGWLQEGSAALHWVLVTAGPRKGMLLDVYVLLREQHATCKLRKHSDAFRLGCEDG